MIACSVLAIVLFFGLNFEYITSNSICARCGRIVRRQAYAFSWSKDINWKIISSTPTVLTELWNDPQCNHGGYVKVGRDKLTGPEKDNHLIFFQGNTTSLFTWMCALGHAHSSYSMFFFTPAGPSRRSGKGPSFRDFLLDKQEADPEFAEKLRRSMQTEPPEHNQFVKDLVGEWKDVNHGRH